MEMRDIDVLNNLKGQQFESTGYPIIPDEEIVNDLKKHDFDPQCYRLSKAEAVQCIKALERQIPQKVEFIGMNTYQCECGNIIHGQAQYCDNCGQRVRCE